ncbi:Lrp/AsnC family transcriptional regulator [Nakamurella lactea]|uniref:Lrp/AsnC family transcriptional regulator n=1 Tax=Nakamurella lactea TaxID=459515 RepID=UPI001B7FC72C|nr:Lrp/AsnC family transcriptional regulator [Nakamurella lactea]
MTGMKLDDLDRRLIAALQVDGRASWTAIAELCETSVPTAARRTQQLIDQGVVKISVMPELGGEGPVESFMVRVRCRPGRQLAVAAELAGRPETRVVALVTGEDDIIAEVIAPRIPGYQAQTLIGLQSIPGVERLRSDLTLHVYKMTHDWSRQLLDGDDTDIDVSEPPRCDPSHLDEQDRAILKAMADDGRTSFRTVSDALGINESTVRRRYDRMHQLGCFRVLTLVAAAALGLESETMLTVRVRPSQLNSVAGELRRHRSVRYIAATLDGNALFCEVIAASTDDLFRFVTETLSSLEGVEGWSSNVELLTVKRGFVQTPWWRAEAGALLGE